MRLIALSTLLGGFGAEVIDRLDVARLFEVGIPDDIDEVVLVSLLVLAKSLAALFTIRLIERRVISHGAARWMTLLYLSAAASVAVAAASSVLALGVARESIGMQRGRNSHALVGLLACPIDSARRGCLMCDLAQVHLQFRWWGHHY